MAGRCAIVRHVHHAILRRYPFSIDDHTIHQSRIVLLHRHLCHPQSTEQLLATGYSHTFFSLPAIFSTPITHRWTPSYAPTGETIPREQKRTPQHLPAWLDLAAQTQLWYFWGFDEGVCDRFRDRPLAVDPGLDLR